MCTSWRQNGRVEVWYHTFLTLALDWMTDQCHVPAALPYGKDPGYCAWYQVSAAVSMRSSLFWVVNAALIGIYLPAFRDSLSVPSSKVKQFKVNSLDCLTVEYKTDMLSRNVLNNCHCRLRNSPSSRVKQSKKIFLDLLTVEDGTDRLSRKVGKYISISAE